MTTAVIGGGASGLMAAYTAAKNGMRVLLLERQARVGRKLLATGNGRCNLTNMNTGAGFYHGTEPGFCGFALSLFGPEKALELFRSLGLVTVTEAGGRVYPLSDQAGSVVDVLRFAAGAAGVETRTGFLVTAIKAQKGGFLISSDGESLKADRVIVCCGGLAGGKLGGGKSGYELLKALGHSSTPLFPALVQLKTDTTYVRSLKGVRADAAVKLEKKGLLIAESAGEVQFTDYGVSGPAVFEISRAASVSRGGLRLRLDFMRETDRGEVEALISRRVADMPSLELENLLTGMLHNRLGRTVLRCRGYELLSPVSALCKADISRIAAGIKDFSLEAGDTLGFDSAQVTAGGVRTSEFFPETLQSRIVPGLYAAGEVLDIDGDCGGYNLQWAWASGRLAGMTL